jgi:hypothetical protein
MNADRARSGAKKTHHEVTKSTKDTKTNGGRFAPGKGKRALRFFVSFVALW